MPAAAAHHVKHRRYGGYQDGSRVLSEQDAGDCPVTGKFCPVFHVETGNGQHHGKTQSVEQLHQPVQQVIGPRRLQIGSQQQIGDQQPRTQAQSIIQSGEKYSLEDRPQTAQYRG